MGMTKAQLSLIKAIAENRQTKIREYALNCCDEDNTQKNRYDVAYYKKLLAAANTKIELPSDLIGMAVLEDTSKFNEKRFYLSEKEKEVVKRIEAMYQVGLKLMERGIYYVNSALLYGESGVGKTTLGKYIAYKLGKPFLYINLNKCMQL